jgi:hypothetical protein
MYSSNMTFIDSAGVHAIMNAAANLPSGCLILHGVDNRTQRILDSLGIGQAPNLHVIPCEKALERGGLTVGLVEPSTPGGEGLEVSAMTELRRAAHFWAVLVATLLGTPLSAPPCCSLPSWDSSSS